ncbi:hypothetical protein [Actinomadura harenae]|uniref:Uncharacterized protein n=1 Tax=Actinomadura harenae TaxID=2483351 RepID=A0A3M2LZT3_9ACTN|nr:hypothetical protein [Actinomadura harenae]RMI41605.1 hypothetical protein EBO15_22670 [Actinomadura harenae]
MTDLYIVSFDECDDRTLTGRVHLYNPDAASFPKGKTFPAQLLMDAWSMMLNGFSFEQAPFDRDEGVRLASEASGAAAMRELEELLFGKRVWVDAGGHLLKEGSKKLREPRVKASEVYKDDLHPYGGIGREDGRHFVTLRPKPDEFRRRADGMIMSYDLGRPANLPQGRPPERLHEDALYELLDRPFEERPYAPFTVKVTSARHLEPLAGGMRWRTALSGQLPEL